MPYYDFFWTEDIIAHIAAHGITPKDFERVVVTAYEVPEPR